MNKKRNWFLLMTGVLLASSACNLISHLFNPLDETITEIEELSTQIDIEEIKTIATDIPSALDDLPNLDDLGDLGDFGDLDATVQALQEGFTSDEIPADIPVVEDLNEILFSSKNVVTYSTSMDLATVISFYQDEMPTYDWKVKEDLTEIHNETAVLQYEKSGRNAIVTLSSNMGDGFTYVMITIGP